LLNVPGLTQGGYTPDYLGTFSNDPEYTAALGEVGAQRQADRTQMLNAIRGLAVQWGGDLTQLLQSGLVDQATVDQAKANQFSTTAEQARDLTRGQGQLMSQLAARGMLNSGATTVGQSLLQENFDRNTNKAASDLNQNVNSLQSQFLQNEAARNSQMQSVRASVYMRLAQMQAAMSVPPTVYQPSTAHWDPGVGGYVTEDGRIYDGGGNLTGFGGSAPGGGTAPIQGQGSVQPGGTLAQGIYWDPVQGKYVTPPGYRGM